MKELESNDPDVLKYRYDLNPIIIVGGLVSLVGAILLGYRFYGLYQTEPFYKIDQDFEVTGMILWLAFFSLTYRAGFFIDRKTVRILRWWGLMRPLLKLKVPISNDSRLILTTAPVPVRFYFLLRLFTFKKGVGKMYVLNVDSPKQDDSQALFPIIGGKTVFEIIGEQKAKDLAYKIAAHLDMPLEDKTQQK
jgi:hypothetical protein